MNDHNVTAEQASRMIASEPEIVLLDVRTEAEYSGELGHLKNAILIPVQDLETRMEELEPYRGKKILAYCRTGRRSQTAGIRRLLPGTFQPAQLPGQFGDGLGALVASCSHERP